MGEKLKKQELLKLIDQIQIVDKIPKQSLEELCKIFRVDEQTSDISSLNRLFKDKICDIICQEGDTYMDYLQLPKFKSLKSDLTDLMFTLFRTVWEEYVEFGKRQKVNSIKKEIDQITPTFDSLRDIQRFHLNLLQLYRESSICPKNSKDSIKLQVETKPIPASNNSFLFSNSSSNNGINPNITNQMGSSIYPYYSFPPPHPYPKVEVAEGAPYIVQNKPNCQGMYQYARLGMSQQPPSFYTSPAATQFYIEQKRRQQLKQYENGESIQKYGFGLSFYAAGKKFINYEFIQCVCEGKKGHETKDSFKCIGCEYQYHASCLSIEFNSDRIAFCPLCILRKESIFCKIVNEPIKFNWYPRQNAKGLKIQMTMEQSQRIHEFRKKGYSFQVKFLKIEGKQFRAQTSKLEGDSNEQGYPQEIPKHTQIFLPELPEDKNNPIFLQIHLRSNQTEDNTKLYFFALFQITFRKIDEIVDELFASEKYVKEDYYDELRDCQGKVQVNLIDKISSKGSIHHPVRGHKCRHKDVFDFKSFLQMTITRIKDSDYEAKCPICSTVCSSFKYDETLYKCIANFEQYETKMATAIQLKKGGEYSWIMAEKNTNFVTSIAEIQNFKEPINQQPINFKSPENPMEEHS